MAFTGTVYSNVSGATTAVAGQTVQSAVWNNNNTDLGAALTQAYSQVVAMLSFRNIMYMNGSLDIWQRGAGSGASIAVAQNTTAYTADRWYITTGATQASIVAVQGPLANASQFSAIVSRNTGQTGATAMQFGYPLDTDECFRMRGKKVTFQALVQAGANWSPASGTLTVNLFVGTGTVQKAGAAGVNFSGLTTALTLATNLTPGGSIVALSATSSAIIPTTTTQAELQFSWTPTGTAGAADNFLLDDVQIEIDGSASTWAQTNYDRVPFEVCELACKRHYVKTFSYNTAPSQTAGPAGALTAIAIATQRTGIYWQYPIEMRTTAAVTTFSTTAGSANWQDVVASVSVFAIIESTNTASQHGVFIYTTTSGSTTNNWLAIHAQADSGI